MQSTLAYGDRTLTHSRARYTQEWTFISDALGTTGRRQSKHQRRIGVQSCSAISSRKIGRALTFAKKGETFDLLL